MSEKQKKKTHPPAPFLSEDSEACFKHFSALVAGIPSDEQEILNADPAIVRVNVERGVDEIRPHLDTIKRALPLLDTNRVLELPSIALALAFAYNRVIQPASPQEIAARQASLRPARAMTLDYLEIAAQLGLVPAARVKKIRADRGPVDEAEDAVAIAALFREHEAALKNKHPFPAQMLQQLDDDGHWLLKQLLPAGATREKSERSTDAIVRDQLWTDMQSRYDDLYQAGVAIWGRRKVDEHIPALRSRVSAKAAAAPAEKAEPAKKSGDA